MPICALAAAPLGAAGAVGEARAAAGAILIAGGLAGLGLLPDASVRAHPAAAGARRRRARADALGADRGGARGALAAGDPRRLDDRRPPRRGRRRPAGADAGVHRRPRDRARERRAGRDRRAARLRRVDPSSKLDLATRIADQIAAEGDKVPVVGPAFEPLPDRPGGARGDGRAADGDRVGDRQRRYARVQRLVPDRRRVRARGAGADRARAGGGSSCERSDELLDRRGGRGLARCS